MPPAPPKQNSTLATVGAFAKDMGGAVPIRPRIDSSAALSMIGRTGLGKAKHIDIQHLWLQEVVRNNKLTVDKILSETYSFDSCTKHLTKREIGDLEEARELLCMRLWIRVQMANLARTGRG